MFFLNLSAVEFIALLGTLSSVITALYLLDKRKRKRVVSTLRFWTSASSVDQRRSRRHMQQPWSLLLQLLSLTLLLLAIADLQWGSRSARPSDHVLLLDTSSWAGAQLSPGNSVMDEERRAAEKFLRALPSSDRVLIVYADALARAAGPVTSERKEWSAMLASAVAGPTVLDLNRAIAFARNTQSWSAGSPGEIVYIGPGRCNAESSGLPKNLRAIIVAAPRENVGIRSASARISEGSRNGWNASFAIANDGKKKRTIALDTSFAGTRFAQRTYNLLPKSEVTATYSFVTRTAGSLQAAITASGDALALDDQIQLALPGNSPLHVAAFTRRRDSLEPLLSADNELTVEYFDPSRYGFDVSADLFIFDEFAPARLPEAPSLFLHPPQNGSPLPVKETVRNASFSGWDTRVLGDAGLRTRELRFNEAEVFQSFKGDLAIASVASGPVVVARRRAEGGRVVVVGFDVLSEAARSDLTTPLLFANLLGWLSPQAFRDTSFTAEHAGAVSIPLEAGETAESLRVGNQAGELIPFSVAKGSIQLFTERPREIRLQSGGRSRLVSLTLPDVSNRQWSPPASVQMGLPQSYQAGPLAISLWKWLAVLGGAGLLMEWILFGRVRQVAFRRTGERPQTSPGVDREKESDAKDREHVSK